MTTNKKKKRQHASLPTACLSPDQLRVGESYLIQGGSGALFLVFHTKEELLKLFGKPQEGFLRQNEVFFVVDSVKLPKRKPCGLREYAIKILAGDVMGWFLAHEKQRYFKKLEPEDEELVNKATAKHQWWYISSQKDH